MTHAKDVQALFAREGLLLDEGRWQDWLDLYLEDACFWAPARRDDGSLTSDPLRELSLIYYEHKERLRERVSRITSGRSPASTPRQRTVHMIGEAVEAGDASFKLPFSVHVYDIRSCRCGVFFGHYVVQVRQTQEGLRIAAKTVLLANDHFEMIADIYSL